MAKSAPKCPHPEKRQQGTCSSAQIRKCHGTTKKHPCSGRSAKRS